MSDELSTAEFRCPGESYSISRAVHLARLADFYPACRDCPRRAETGGLSSRQVRRLDEIHARPQDRPWFDAEGIRETAINDMSPQIARAIGIEFARALGDQAAGARAKVVFAGDGRLSTATIVAAVVEGIRWTGCETIDLGPASAPCAAAAIEHLAADGGIYLGSPRGGGHTVGMKFWRHGEPLSCGEVNAIAASIAITERQIDRPIRAFGPLRRINAEEIYLGDLRPAYHALRPLRFVIRCTCGPVLSYLDNLLRAVACRMIPAESGSGVGGQVAAAKAHFGIEIADDGENAQVFDDQGRTVAAEHLLALLSSDELVFSATAANRETSSQDALRTLTLLLVLLSRGDAAFSAVLDRAVAVR